MTSEIFLRLTLEEQLDILINDTSSENLVRKQDKNITLIIQYMYGFYVELQFDCHDRTVTIKASENGTEILGKHIQLVNIDDLFLPFY